MDEVHIIMKKCADFRTYCLFDSLFFNRRKTHRVLKAKAVFAFFHSENSVRQADFFIKIFQKNFEYTRAKRAKYFPRGEFYDYGQNRAYFNHYRRT